MVTRITVTVSVLLMALLKPVAAAETLNVYMNWTIHGQHGPWFIAKSKGYFSEAGLDVNIQRGYGSGDTVKKVLAGVADIGFTDPVPIILAISEGQPIRAFFGGFMTEPCVLHSAAENGNIRGPKELEGKIMGGPPGDICIILLRAVMEKAGADYTKVKIENMDAPTRLPMLATGRIDAAADFTGSEILWEKGLTSAGKRRVSWRYNQFIEKYGLMVVAHEKTIKQKPETLRKLTLALLRGYQDHVKDPEMAASLVLQAHPELDRDYVRSSARALLETVWDETTRSKGIGILNPDKMQSTVDIVDRYWKLPRKPSTSEVFTNEFIEWAHGQTKK